MFNQNDFEIDVISTQLERYFMSHIIYFYVVFMVLFVLFEAWQALVTISFHLKKKKKTSFVFYERKKKVIQTWNDVKVTSHFLTPLSLVLHRSEVAILYNDRSVLENHHVSAAYRLMQEDEMNILVNLSKDDWRYAGACSCEEWRICSGKVHVLWVVMSRCVVFPTGSCVHWWSRWSWAQICPAISSRSRRWGTYCSSRRGEWCSCCSLWACVNMRPLMNECDGGSYFLRRTH